MKNLKLNEDYLKYPTAEDILREIINDDMLDAIAVASIKFHLGCAKQNVDRYKSQKNLVAWEKEDMEYSELLLAAFCLVGNYYGIDTAEYKEKPTKKSGKPKTKNSKKS
jgi:hypothetical protein